MGKAAAKKRLLRDAGPLPDRFAFGPEFLVNSSFEPSPAPLADPEEGQHDAAQER
jgi:hypothetical protein